tara:strand:+ start:27 stop:323 length:297 start_codon:yes stop_codon:yes gene_type:complete
MIELDVSIPMETDIPTLMECGLLLMALMLSHLKIHSGLTKMVMGMVITLLRHSNPMAVLSPQEPQQSTGLVALMRILMDILTQMADGQLSTVLIPAQP